MPNTITFWHFCDQLATFLPNLVQNNCQFRFFFVQNAKFRDFVRFFVQNEFLASLGTNKQVSFVKAQCLQSLCVQCSQCMFIMSSISCNAGLQSLVPLSDCMHSQSVTRRLRLYHCSLMHWRSSSPSFIWLLYTRSCKILHTT